MHLHLPEWRDSQAVTRQVVTALNLGVSKVVLSGARGDRLLLAGLSGDWSATIRIDGNVGSELAREMNSPGITVLATGDVGAGAGSGLKAGRLLILGRSGALAGTQIENGEIWCLGPAGNRLGYRASGGLIVVGDGLGLMAMDRRVSGTVRIQAFPNPSPEAANVKTVIDEALNWSEDGT
ncbi:MAG: hypothetical protein RJA81_1064 [Planctomycetota bacterium]|jgi:glutamate synthase domain-containing protein 3